MTDTAGVNVQLSNLTFASKGAVLNVNLNFVTNIDQVQLNRNDSLLLIGKAKDLRQVNHQHLSKQLTGLQIPQQWFSESLNHVCPNKKQGDDLTAENKESNSGSSISWLNKFIIQKVSAKCSRTNTPSRAHLYPKLISANSYGENQLILVACERRNSVALACAVTRAFPTYSRKSTTNASNTKKRNVYVSFFFVDEQQSGSAFPNDEETNCFNTLARSIQLTSRIIETPCADMTTDHFLEEIRAVGRDLGIEPFVIEGEELNRQGFGGIYNVGKAAINPPKLVVLSHLRTQAKRTVAWVGKGIVYDTGGLCIKSRPGMCTMKQDCGGAAGVLGAFYSAVRLGFEDNLHAVFCLAENAIGPLAYRPDDIITLYSGKTVEITNTDAEGRVVLGDGVAYAEKDLKADVIVDMATLTGAQGPATGRYHAALLTNNEQWERACVQVGKNCGDLCFPLVFAPELHFSEFKSELADMRNSVIKPDNAASACAGLFIHSHLSSKYDGIWIHLDIASPVSDGDRATGFGVALLNNIFAESHTNVAFRRISANDSVLPLKNETQSDNDD